MELVTHSTRTSLIPELQNEQYLDYFYIQEDKDRTGKKNHIGATFESIYQLITLHDRNKFYETWVKPDLLERLSKIKYFIDYDLKTPNGKPFDEQTDEDVKANFKDHKTHIKQLIETVTKHLGGGQVDGVNQITPWILKSCPTLPYKISYHIIFDGMHSDVISWKNFTKNVVLPELALIPNFTESAIDLKNYGSNRCLRLPYCTKGSEPVPRPLKYVDTTEFMNSVDELGQPQEIVTEKLEDITVAQFKKMCVTYIEETSSQFTYTPPVKEKQSQKKTRLIAESNEGDLYTEREIVKMYLDMLTAHRWSDRSKWMNVGYILKSLDERYVDLFHNFSSKWAQYNPIETEKHWKSFTFQHSYTLHNLMNLARLDSPDQFASVKTEIPKHDLKHLSDFDNKISTFVYRMYMDKFVCADPKSDQWFYYNGVRWILSNKSYHLRKLLIEDVFNMVQSYRRTLAKSSIEDSDAQTEQKLKTFSSILKKLSTGALPMCMDIAFYNDKFFKMLDQNRYILGFENGVLELGENGDCCFREGDPSDYLSMSTGYDFEAMGKDHPACVYLTDLITKIIPNDAVRHFTMKTLAACLDGTQRDERFYVWAGKNGMAGGGKSTMLDLVSNALGDYTGTVPTSLFTRKGGNPSSANSALFSIVNKRLVHMAEPEYTDKIQVGFLKAVTAGDTLSVRELYGKQQNYKLHAKYIMGCNKIPNLSDLDLGVSRRLLIILFVSKFVDNPAPTKKHEYTRDPELKSKLASLEYKVAFMNILIEYYGIYRREGLNPPEEVLVATKKFEWENNQIKQFVEENIRPGGQINLIDLKALWNGDSTLKSVFENKFQIFKKQLEVCLQVEFKTYKKEMCIRGFRIKDAEDPDNEENQEEAADSNLAEVEDGDSNLAQGTCTI